MAGRDQPPASRRWILLAGIAAAVAVLAGVSLRPFWSPPPPAPPRVGSIAVLPLVSLSDDPKHEFFADAITDGLINTLGRVSALKITARTSSIMPFKRTTKSIAEIARALGVDAVVEGSTITSVDADGRGHVRVSINLIDPVSQTQLWNVSLERGLVDVPALQNEIVRLLAENIKVAVTPSERARLAQGGTVKSEALRLYLLGRDEWNGRTAQRLNNALGYFTQATEADPSYAPAYAGLADTYALLGADFGMPREAAMEAAMANACQGAVPESNARRGLRVDGLCQPRPELELGSRGRPAAPGAGAESQLCHRAPVVWQPPLGPRTRG